MGLFKGNSQGAVADVIRCDEKSYLIWKWRPAGSQLGTTSRENTIRWGSPIRVKEGSVAVFVYSNRGGFSQDYIAGPADTIVATENFPVLASLEGLVYNGGAPFQAEVYFINLAESIQAKFAVPYFDVFDPELKEFSVPVAVRGTIDFNIVDYQNFVNKHRLDDFSVDELRVQIKDTVVENVKSTVGKAPEHYGIPVVQIERMISEIKEDVLSRLREKVANDYGICLKDINISALEINKDSEGYQELKAVTKDLTAETRKAKAKADVKDIAASQKLGVFEKAARIFVDVKENSYARRKQTEQTYKEEHETELAGRVGAAGAKIASAFVKKKENGLVTPPPIPATEYYLVIEGKQAGPYDIETLKKMAEEGTLLPDSLVWTKGMDNWNKAKTRQDLISVFNAVSEENNIPPVPIIPDDQK